MSENKRPMGQVKQVYSTDRYENEISKNIYEFCSNSYYGTGGYVTGEYLVPHPKEKDVTKRIKISTYNNYVKGMIDSLLIPVFSKPAVRATNNELFEGFIEDCDNKGNHIQKFTANAVKYTRLHGVSFVVMDNFSTIPELLSAQLEDRVYPYVYLVTADRVVDYGLDKAGNLNSITFVNGYNGDHKKYTTITDKYFVDTYDKDGVETQIGTKKYHKLGKIPVISLYDSLSDEVLPFPPSFDICRINWQVFNQSSEQRVVERNSSFAMLAIDNGGEDISINMDIGSNTVLSYGSRDKTLNAPQWISPDGSVLQNMMEIANNSIAKLLEAGTMLGVQTVESNTSSAKQIAYKFIGASYAIKKTARLAEELEEMMADLFAVYIRTSFEYVVKYNDDYMPSEIEITTKIDNYKKILELELPETTVNLIKQHISEELLSAYQIETETDK